MSQTTDRYSDGSYLESNPDWHQIDSPFKARCALSLLDRGSVQYKSLVEVGCGAGGVLRELNRLRPGADYSGYEISQDAQQFWSDSEGIEFRLTDFLTETTQSDVLLLCDVFEHVDDYIGFLRALLPRAERFVFNIPIDLNVVGTVLDQQVAARRRYGHLHYFSVKTAIATLEYCGYKIELSDIVPSFKGVPKASGRASIQQKLLYPLRYASSALSPRLSAKMFGGSHLVVLASVAP
jgi:hypothetical protein